MTKCIKRLQPYMQAGAAQLNVSVKIPCVAVIGPSISQQAFEVGNEVRIAFEEAGFPTSIIDNTTRSKPHIDLWAANVYLLEEAGVKLSNIQIANVCTYVHSDVFFSARKLGINSGRIYSAIFLN